MSGNKMCKIYMTEYYWAIKKNEVLISATTWLKFENLS